MAEAKAEEVTVNVVTYAPGTLGSDGIVPIGSKKEIPLHLFSDKWMRPADKASAQKTNALMKQRKEAREAAAEARKAGG